MQDDRWPDIPPVQHSSCAVSSLASSECYNGLGVSDMDFDRASPMPHLSLMLLMWMDYTRIRYSYGMDTMRQRLIVTVP